MTLTLAPALAHGKLGAHDVTLFATIVSTSALAATPPAPESLAPLLQTISERLTIADQVALTKWDSGKPVEDSLREQQVIANAAEKAQSYQLKPEEIGPFISAQIEANKLVQYALLAKWRDAGKAPVIARPDLVKQWINCRSSCCSNTPRSPRTGKTRSARPGWLRRAKTWPRTASTTSPWCAPWANCVCAHSERTGSSALC